jgi:hypothetical protein
MRFRIACFSMLKFTALCVGVLLVHCSACSSPPERRKSKSERREAMLQMQRNVGLVHSHTRLMRNKSGFPESQYRTPEGTITCSWRLTVFSGLSTSGPYPNQLWNSPFNQAADNDEDRRIYAVTSRSQPSPFTQVFALVGPGTAFTEFGVGKGRDTKDAEPGAILLLDCKNHLIHWMEPGDVDVSVLKRSKEFGFENLEPNYPEGFLVAFVDGAVWWIKKDVPSDVISQFYTLEGAQSHDREKELAPYVLDKIPPLKKHDGQYFIPSSDEQHSSAHSPDVEAKLRGE